MRGQRVGECVTNRSMMTDRAGGVDSALRDMAVPGRRQLLFGLGLTALASPWARAARAQSPAAGPSAAPSIAPAQLPDRTAFPGATGIYMNSAAFHPRQAAAQAVRREALRAMAGEEGFRPDKERVRRHFAEIVNADPDEVAFVPTTQIGESFIAAALGLPEAGAHIVTDHLHFVGSLMMYTDMQKRGVEVSWIKPSKGALRVEDYDRAIVKGKTRLVALSSTSMVNGAEPDVAAIVAIAHARGAFVHVDAIQTIGNTPFDVKACGADSLCAGTYKWLMAPGTAFLYVAKVSLAKLRTPFYHFYQYDYPDGRYLPRTHVLPYDAPGAEVVDEYWPKAGPEGMFGIGYEPSPEVLAELEYTLPYIRKLGIANIHRHNASVADALKSGLRRRGFELMTPDGARSPIVTFAYPDAERIAPALRAAGVKITTRWNHVRIAPSVFNTVEQAQRLLDVLPERRW